MSGFVGVLVSDPWLQSQFTQVELRSLKSKVTSSLSLLFITFSLLLIFKCLFFFFFGLVLVCVDED